MRACDLSPPDEPPPPTPVDVASPRLGSRHISRAPAMSSWSRVLARAARDALGLTPSNDQLASALLGLPPKAARAKVHRMAAVALAAELGRAPPRDAHPHDLPGRDRDRRRHPSPPAEVRRSRVPNAGHGLFATRRVARGELVAVYAGVYTPPAPPVTPGADGVSILIPRAVPGDDGRYVVHLPAGGYLDGAEHAARARTRADAGACAGWGVAALANHPPEGRAPNVEAVEVRWEETRTPGWTRERDGETLDDPGDADARRSRSSTSPWERAARASLNPTTSATWYVDGATGEAAKVPPSVPTRGLAFLARREMEPGEEVFFDYRLDPGDEDLPEWYRPTDPEERWRVVDEAEVGTWRGYGEGDWGPGALQ